MPTMGGIMKILWTRNIEGTLGNLGIFPGEDSETDHQEDGRTELPRGIPDGEERIETKEDPMEDNTG